MNQHKFHFLGSTLNCPRHLVTVTPLRGAAAMIVELVRAIA
jgi:hypothetical protein